MENREGGEFKSATFGGGCFWCTEAVFRRVRGVLSVRSGYAGGDPGRATYEEVCSGTTGHAEVVRIDYDPGAVSFRDLLRIFFETHDPTTPDRQGNDRGPQYRSVIFYHDEEQREEAGEFMESLARERRFSDPVVTELSPLGVFVEAEGYHQEYFERNPGQGYCAFVIAPKVEKFRLSFAPLLKKEFN